MDFAALLAALSAQSGPLGVALAAIAGIVILPGVVRWGYDQVVGWFDDEQTPDDDESEADECDERPCQYCHQVMPADQLHIDGESNATCSECYDYTSNNE